MLTFHIVLFKLKPNVTKAQIDTWSRMGHGMLGRIPGLRELSMSPPLPKSTPRSQGFSMCLVALLDKAEDIDIYMAHPAHVRFREYGETLYDDILAYDMESWNGAQNKTDEASAA